MSVLPQATILCIDDNETALKMRQLALEMAGYSVLTASDSELAMKLLTSSAVDVVMSDHLLEGTTGTELAAEMKRLKQSQLSLCQGWCKSPRAWNTPICSLVKPKHLLFGWRK
jgi:CheY-like chemotaxis protein